MQRHVFHHAEHLARNPNFFFDLVDPDPTDADDATPVVVSLAQDVGKDRKDKDRLAIGFKVYRLPEKKKSLDEEFLKRNNSV